MRTWEGSPQGDRLTIRELARCAAPVVIGRTDRHIDVYHDGRDLSICNRCAALQPGLVTHRPLPLSGRCQTCGAANNMTAGPDTDRTLVVRREITEGDLTRCVAPVRLCETHPQVDWWRLQGERGACNHCGAVVPAAAFDGGPYDGNRCPWCGTPEVGPGLSTTMRVPDGAPAVLAASFSRLGSSRASGYLVGAAAAVLALWIANSYGGVGAVLTLEVVVAICGWFRAVLPPNAMPGGANIGGPPRREARSRTQIVVALVALVGSWAVWIALDWPGFSLLATVAVGATVGNALLNRRSSGAPAWRATLVQKASEDEALRLPIDVDEGVRYQLGTLGVPAQNVESVARGVVLVAFRLRVMGREIDMRGKVAPQSQLAQLLARFPFVIVDELDGQPQSEVRRLIRLTRAGQELVFVCSVRMEESGQGVRFGIGPVPTSR